jgi:hypothetical protein
VRHLRPLLLTLCLIVVPLAALNWFSNLPKPEPEIPIALKTAGFHGIDGEAFERELSKDSRLRFNGATAVIACPSTLIVSETTVGLCGYCKVSDFVIYPSWLPGFTMKLETADFDYRSFYSDALHDRFFMRTHNFEDMFSSNPRWNAAKGRWFSCRDSSELDVNAYIEVSYENGKPTYVIGEYLPLGQVRKQGFVSP